MTDRPVLTWYVRAPHESDVEMDFDLIVRAYDQKDAKKLWVEYWEDEYLDYDKSEFSIRELIIPEGRGVVAWN